MTVIGYRSCVVLYLQIVLVSIRYRSVLINLDFFAIFKQILGERTLLTHALKSRTMGYNLIIDDIKLFSSFHSLAFRLNVEQL